MTRLCSSSSAVLVLLLSFFASTAAAQTPDTGMFAAGGDVGFLFPDDAFETTLTVDGYGEYYFTPRVSLRTMLGWANPGVDGRTEDHFRQVRLLFNGVYNWEFGSWHPFVTGGAGAYFTRLLREDRDDPDGDVRGGINFGGGTEFFLDDMTSVKGEARVDLVSHPSGHPDATSFALTFGFKRYF